jgi:hypothetical protein
VRWNTNTDTPLPPDEPTAPNPPEGAIIDYYLKTAAAGPVTLEILAGDGKVVRRYSSEDEVFRPDPSTITIPLYWFRPPLTLATTAGMHRFTWDVHYQPIDGVNRVGGPTLPIAAIGHNTVPAPATPWVNPGAYTVRLTVEGKSYTQPIVVKQDPRVKTPALAMQQVYALSKAAYEGAVAAQEAVSQASEMRARIAKLQPQASGATAEALAAFDRKVESVLGTPSAGGRGRGQGPGAGGGRGGAGAAAADTLTAAVTALSNAMNSLQGADVQPTTLQLNAIARARALGTRMMTRWSALRTTELETLNATLKSAGMPAILVPPGGTLQK